MSLTAELRKYAGALKPGESLHVEALVEAAKSKRKWPLLHNHLWGVSEGALAHEARLNRAHMLIVTVKVTTKPGVQTRAFVHIKSTPGYVLHEVVKSDVNLADVHLKRLRDDIGRVIQVYKACADDLDPAVAGPLGEALETAWQRTFAKEVLVAA